MGWRGSLGSIVGVSGDPRLFYVNVSGMRPRPFLFSQPFMIPGPWGLRVKWSIPLVKFFHPG